MNSTSITFLPLYGSDKQKLELSTVPEQLLIPEKLKEKNFGILLFLSGFFLVSVLFLIILFFCANNFNDDEKLTCYTAGFFYWIIFTCVVVKEYPS